MSQIGGLERNKWLTKELRKILVEPFYVGDESSNVQDVEDQGEVGNVLCRHPEFFRLCSFKCGNGDNFDTCVRKSRDGNSNTARGVKKSDGAKQA